MHVVFIVLTIIVAVLLIGIVLIQKSKGGGLSSQFGGGNQVLGVRGTNSFLEKTTWTLAALILVFSVASAYTLPPMSLEGKDAIRSHADATAQQAAEAQANAFNQTSAEQPKAEAAPAQEAQPAAAAAEEAAQPAAAAEAANN
jgi:preprotein translocase subunit SecG